MLKRSSGVYYALFNLASGRPEPGGAFPAETSSFLSKPSNIPLQLNPSVVVCVFRVTWSRLYKKVVKVNYS